MHKVRNVQASTCTKIFFAKKELPGLFKCIVCTIMSKLHMKKLNAQNYHYIYIWGHKHGNILDQNDKKN